VSDLTKEEQGHVGLALRFLRARAGGWDALAKVLHFGRSTLLDAASGRHPPTASMALRIARLAQVGVDDLLAGRYPEAGACAHCGNKSEVSLSALSSPDDSKIAIR
jgi:hypothetical protein